MQHDLIYGWRHASARRTPGFLAEQPLATAARPDVPIGDSSEAHCLVVAPTGSGKGRSVIIPNLLHWPHSAIVVDVKGEAAHATARYRRSLGQKVFLLDPFRRVTTTPDTLNPIDWLSCSPEFLGDNATTLADTVTGDRISKNEPFWDILANDFMAGLIAKAASEGDPAQRNLGHVFNLMTGDDPIYALAVEMDTKPNMHPFARRQIGAFLLHESDKVRPSVRSTAQQHLRLFGNPLAQAAVRTTSIDLDAIRTGTPTTTYLVMPATRLQSHSALLRIWLATLLGCIAEREHQPERPTLLIVDELAQVGGLPIILQALTLLRGYGLRVMVVLQSLAQLRALYPSEYQTVLDNCGTVLAFGMKLATLANPVAELLGDISGPQLMQMRPDELAVCKEGEPTFIARKLDYLTDAMFAGRFDPNPLYVRRQA